MSVLLLMPVLAWAAELQQTTLTAYEEYIAEFEKRFTQLTSTQAFLADASPERRKRLLAGEILAGAGHQDGIIDAPGGLIHHWRATAFLTRVTLADVLALAQDYAAYKAVYDDIVGSGLVAREGDRYRAYMRLKRSAGVVTGVIDLWAAVDYRRPAPDRAVAVSRSECVRQVHDAGTPNERLLPPGMDSGYLWRANTLSKYLARDGGVFVELDSIGLSRRFPPMLGWIIEPIARRLGRSSAEDTLIQLRRATARLDQARPEAASHAVPTPLCAE